MADVTLSSIRGSSTGGGIPIGSMIEFFSGNAQINSGSESYLRVGAFIDEDESATYPDAFVVNGDYFKYATVELGSFIASNTVIQVSNIAFIAGDTRVFGKNANFTQIGTTSVNLMGTTPTTICEIPLDYRDQFVNASGNNQEIPRWIAIQASLGTIFLINQDPVVGTTSNFPVSTVAAASTVMGANTINSVLCSSTSAKILVFASPYTGYFVASGGSSLSNTAIWTIGGVGGSNTVVAAASDGTTVIAPKIGTVPRSGNFGTTWANMTGNTNVTWGRVEWIPAISKFVLVGNGGRISTVNSSSTALLDSTSSTASNLNSIGHLKTANVILAWHSSANSGYYQTSNDALTWTERTYPWNTTALRAVGRPGETERVCLVDGTHYTDDGLDWFLSEGGYNSNTVALVFGSNGHLVTSSGIGVPQWYTLTSEAGMTPKFKANNAFSGIFTANSTIKAAVGSDRIVVVSGNTAAYSTNGVSFVAASANLVSRPGANTSVSVAYGSSTNTYVVAVNTKYGSTNHTLDILSSADGAATWTSRLVLDSVYGATTDQYPILAYGNSIFVCAHSAVVTAKAPYLISSDGGATWVEVDPRIRGQITGILGYSGGFYAYSSTKIQHSTDGINYEDLGISGVSGTPLIVGDSLYFVNQTDIGVARPTGITKYRSINSAESSTISVVFETPTYYWVGRPIVNSTSFSKFEKKKFIGAPFKQQSANTTVASTSTSSTYIRVK